MSYSRDSSNDLVWDENTGEYVPASSVIKPEYLYGWKIVSAGASTNSELNIILYTANAIPAAGDSIYDQYGTRLNKKVDKVFGDGISFKVALNEKKVDVDNFNYTIAEGKVILTKYVGTEITEVVIPKLEDK